MKDAKIVTEAGHTWWKCPNCTQRLAEIIGERVVIRSQDRLISLRSDADQDQVCWRCGIMSRLDLPRKGADNAYVGRTF